MEETKIPEFVLKLAEGCSTYAKLAAKYWIAAAVISMENPLKLTPSRRTKLTPLGHFKLTPFRRSKLTPLVRR